MKLGYSRIFGEYIYPEVRRIKLQKVEDLPENSNGFGNQENTRFVTKYHRCGIVIISITKIFAPLPIQDNILQLHEGER